MVSMFDLSWRYFGFLWNILESFDSSWANLKLKPSKCDFAAKELKYLGHIISKYGIRTDPEKSHAVSTFPVPKT